MEKDSNQIDELIGLALAGDGQAYERLLTILMVELRNLCIRWVSNLEDREDLIQDILLSLHLSRASYNPQLPFRPWLYSLARRRTIDYLRKKRRQKIESVEIEGISVLGDISSALSCDIIECLNDRERDVFRRVYLGNESNVSIAKSHDITEGALRVVLHRIKEKVKRAL